MKIISVPFSAGSLGKNIGCEKAPGLILKDMKFEVLNVDNQDIVNSNKILESAEGDFFIGGDHSITYSLFKGFTKGKDKENTGILIFDAHPDCVNNFSPPTHEDFLKTLIEKKVVKKENVFIIGIRAIDKIEREFIEKKQIKHVLMSDLKSEDSYSQLINQIKEFVGKFDSWYLSIDIDVLNPEESPGTGYLEKNGMSFHNLKNILEEISDFKNLKRIDLVEVNPDKDIDEKTINCAKKIVKIFDKNKS